MNVIFYFDPSCPFCWITSRWLESVAPQRDLTIDWRPFSLAVKNDELTPADNENPYAGYHRAAHRVLRVIEAAAPHGAERGKLYADFGKMMHVDGGNYDDAAIEIALGVNELPLSLVGAADDTSHDAALVASVDSALAIVGDDVGVPIIVLTQDDGTQTGFFGPVLQAMPDEQAALDLWDGLAKLTSVSDFYELKRTRPAGMPDTGSTKQPGAVGVCS